MQTGIQKVKSVRFGSGKLIMTTPTWDVNIGAIRDANLTVTKSINELVLDNAKLPPKVKIDEAVFSCNLYEIALENLQSIDGIADYSTIDGTPVTITNEALWTGWVVDKAVKLANKNGDNTAVTSLVVDAAGTPLILNIDYRVFVGIDGYTYVYPLTVQVWVLTADYEYIPLASKQQVYKDIIKTLATNKFKFVNTDEDAKEFGIEIYEGYNRAGIDATFLPDDTTDDALSIPIEIKAFPVAWSQNLFRIFDEQDTN